jgi:diaminopimelate decarboxylase
MLYPETLNVNEHGHLTIGGFDTVELANRYGTPLYVMDENVIRKALRDYKKSIDENYQNGGMVAYASKACCFKEICRIVMQEGCGIDVVSGGELYTAMQVGFPAERIYFHGNNKTEAELRMALDYGVGRIVVDNITELHLLSEISASMGKKADIYLRITPGIEAHTHDFIKTGQIDSKFGITLENGDALNAVKTATQLIGISLKGLHCHIGSQIFDEQPFIHAAEVMLNFIAQIREQTGVVLKELNLGGGFGVRYTNKDSPKEYGEYMRLVSAVLNEKAEKRNLPVPYIVIEPGRSIVAPAGITLYTVGSIKEIPGIRSYLSIDGGMTDNPRYALYKSPYTAVVANKAGRPADCVYTIAGRCCESGDLIQENVKLQRCRRGDILAVLTTGAYNYSMSSNYNRIPRPAVVMVRDGVSRIVVKAESYEDLVRNDI